MVSRASDTKPHAAGTPLQKFWRKATRPKVSRPELERLAYRLRCKPEAARRAIEIGLI